MEVIKTIKISIDEIKGEINPSEVLELLKNVNDYSSDFRKKVIDSLSFTSDDCFEMVSHNYIERHIKNNLDFYDCTKELKKQIEELQEQTEIQVDGFEDKFQKALDENNKTNVKRCLCDLFDLGYHVNTGDLIDKIIINL